MDDKRQTLRIIWAAMLGSNAVYAAMPLLVPGGEAALDPAIPLALAAGAVMTAVASFVVPAIVARMPVEDDAMRANRSFQLCVVRWALAEAVAIDGIVLFVLGAGTGWLWGLCAASAVLLGIHAPRENALSPHDSRGLARPDVKIG